MKIIFEEYFETYKNEFYSFLHFIDKSERNILVKGDFIKIFFENKNKIENDGIHIEGLINYFQEGLCLGSNIFFTFRQNIGVSEFYMHNFDDPMLQKISQKDYLIVKEEYIQPHATNNTLTLNFEPFQKNSPMVNTNKDIGKGFEYLNKYLSSKMFNNLEKWQNLLFDFLHSINYKSEKLILNDRIQNSGELIYMLNSALKTLAQYPDDKPFDELRHFLQDYGFEKGIGKNNKFIKENLILIDELFHSPDNSTLMKFVSRIPTIFNVLVISPHGYFAQEGVLGLPDTGGQIVYILDQVKALESTLIESLKNSGLNIIPKIVVLTRLIPNSKNTKCNKRLSKIFNTKNSWILRIPFRNHNKKVTNDWISRFEIWPYLEEFAEDSYTALLAQFEGKPDLVIGNYSDGNLVAYLLAKRFNVTQCNIAHAFEKCKYLFSDLYWKDLEDKYNFSLQFTADLIAINSADFILTSTLQEIAGTDISFGQYESYINFTLPGLYRVINGIDIRHTKFNVVSPGVNERIYFSYKKNERRITDIKNYLNELMFKNMEDAEVFGELDKPELTPLFSMARLDSNKNLSSLVKWFGESKEIQSLSNLIIVAGKVKPENSTDKEEIDEINKIVQLIEQYNLYNKIRWIGKLLPKNEAGEVYRVIADHKGIFVHPGLFEGFGLTILEAMISGLPVIATKYGGPFEIIHHGSNGFHIDPIAESESKKIIISFLKEINSDVTNWETISKNAIKRVEDAYNWKLYSNKLLSLSKLYDFWKYTADLDKSDLYAYLEIIYHLLFKKRTDNLLNKHLSYN